jgi:XTP/dITP diphosphohydrolase
MQNIHLLVATLNPGKVREIRQFLDTLPLEVVGLDSLPRMAPCLEDGSTFEANARKKAIYYSSSADALTMADDSGLAVDALEGEPGIFSARYLSETASDEERYRSILEQMKNVPMAQRAARFVCCVAVARHGEVLGVFHGSVEGRIGDEPKGSNGFGYDPIFVVPELGKTMAELNPAEKQEISHRGRALRQLAAWLKSATFSGGKGLKK